ncbi:MAG: FAD-dependent oxidoreductase [Clostridia bacterium]|nr:FAD-dependent oxidoreductase [Clostridia bacterium]
MYYDIIIIGAGTAGLTASIYARRAGKSVLLIEQENFGGQIVYSPLVENYPGIASVSGNAFADSLLTQAEALGAVTELAAVTAISKESDGTFKVCTEYGEFSAGALIAATGASHRKLGLEREEDLTGSGVSYCALCDGAFFKGRDAAVAGGGDTACQDAVFLAGLCRKVYVIHRRDTFRAEQRNVDMLKALPNVELVLNARVTELKGAGELTGIDVTDTQTGAVRHLDVSALFVAVGQIPATGLLRGITDQDEKGYIVAGEDTRTSVPGLFAAGDVRTKSVRQLTTAAADGAVAATEACRFLRENGR